MRDSTSPDADRGFFADSRLAARLRQEALRDRPAFSPSLHARIMRAVENEPIREDSGGVRILRFREEGRGRKVLLISSAAIAATLLIGLVVLWFASNRGEFGPVPPSGTEGAQVAQDSAAPRSVSATSPPEVLETASSLPDIAIRQLQLTLVQVQDRQWAYLDHDAAVAKRLVESQFPTGLAAADTP